MDGKTGHDKIELPIVVGQCRDVAGVEFDAILDAAGPGIVFGGLDVVTGLVSAAPQVDARDPARWSAVSQD